MSIFSNKNKVKSNFRTPKPKKISKQYLTKYYFSFVTRNCMMTTSLRCIQLFVTASCRYRDALRPQTSHSLQLFWHSVKDVPLFFAVGKRLSPLLTHVTAVFTYKRNEWKKISRNVNFVWNCEIRSLRLQFLNKVIFVTWFYSYSVGIINLNRNCNYVVKFNVV